MRIAVAIATTGRPRMVAQMLSRLARQSRRPDKVLVIGAKASDLPAPDAFDGVAFTTSARGSCRQRNRALDLVDHEVDVVIFMDDDFIPAKDFIAGAETLLTRHPDIVAASGRVLADGVRSAGVSLAEADALIEAYESADQRDGTLVDKPAAYGCNMIVRTAALPRLRFDESLPLYGWLEDWDFSAPLAKVGRIVESDLCNGVHLCIKTARSPGLQLGYSQIANPLYLAAKGTMARGQAATVAARCLVSNLIRSFAAEPYVDRRGRLRGNLRALGDLLTGKLHPLHVLDLPARAPAFGASQAMPR